MAKKQTELPGTRRDDEPEPPKPIRALDEACEALERAKGKATKAGQGAPDKLAAIEQLNADMQAGRIKVPPGWPLGVSADFRAIKKAPGPNLRAWAVPITRADLEKTAVLRDEMTKAVDAEIARRAKEVEDAIARHDEMFAHPVTYVHVPPAADADWAAAARARRAAAQQRAPAPPPKPVDPLDAVVDGWTLRDLLEAAQNENRALGGLVMCGGWRAYSPAQRGAVSAHWSAELRAKVAAGAAPDAAAWREQRRARERLRVVVDLEDP